MSGGPMVAQHGEVIGVIAAKAMPQEGIAFGIPATWVLDFLRRCLR